MELKYAFSIKVSVCKWGQFLVLAFYVFSLVFYIYILVQFVKLTRGQMNTIRTPMNTSIYNSSCCCLFLKSVWQTLVRTTGDIVTCFIHVHVPCSYDFLVLYIPVVSHWGKRILQYTCLHSVYMKLM